MERFVTISVQCVAIILFLTDLLKESFTNLMNLEQVVAEWIRRPTSDPSQRYLAFETSV